MEELKRCPNFTQQEQILLMDLVKKYQSVIDCKKTDSVSWADKNNAWDNIAVEFNSDIGGVPRSAKNLRGKYENLKKTAKKKLVAEKSEIFQTGGGIPKIVNILDVKIEGPENSFDSDSIDEAQLRMDHDYAIKQNMNIYPESDQSALLINRGTTAVTFLLEEGTSAAEALSQRTFLQNEQYQSNTGSPASTKRKRTNLPSDCRTQINALSEARLDLVKIQCNIAKQEEQFKRQEAELRLKILQAEYENKEEQHKLQVAKLKLEIKLLTKEEDYTY